MTEGVSATTKECQRAGIGAEVLTTLLADWKPTAKPIVLTVLKNNPVHHLYQRFGFFVAGEAGVNKCGASDFTTWPRLPLAIVVDPCV